MSGLDVAGLVVGVAAGMVPLLRLAHKRVVRYRRRRYLRLQMSGVSPLAAEIDRSRSEIESLYHDYVRSIGSDFARGDDTARLALSGLIIVLQRDLIMVLTSQEGSRIQNPSQLGAVAVSGRRGALSALSELAQRIQISRPLPKRRLVEYSNTMPEPPSATRGSVMPKASFGMESFLQGYPGLEELRAADTCNGRPGDDEGCRGPEYWGEGWCARKNCRFRRRGARSACKGCGTCSFCGRGA